MQFLRRAPLPPAKLGILPGTFNPPTQAHLALARAGLAEMDEVVFVLPRAFPHKQYEGAGFEDRLRMLDRATSGETRFSIAASEGGLFAEIAQECRNAYGPEARLTILCGRDAAERIVDWDYGRPGAFLEMLEGFELLVAPRAGDYTPPQEMRSRIRPLTMPAIYDDVSATEVRARIARGEPWEDLVPPTIVGLVREIYEPAENIIGRP